MTSLYSAISRRWAARPEAIAIDDEGRSWTRGELDDLSARLHAALHSAGGVVGRPVCLIAQKSVQAFAVYLACLRGGYPFFPINPAYTDSEIDYLVADAAPCIVIAEPSRLKSLKPLADRVSAAVLTLDGAGGGALMDVAAAAREPPPPFPATDDSWAALLYTSGTTGRPKGAALSHENLHANAETLVSAWRFTEHDVLLHMLPIFHVHGLFVAGNTAMLSGARMLWRASFNPREAVERLSDATAFMGVPTLYTRLLGEPGLDPDAVRNIRLFVSGSAPLDPTTFEAFKARTGHVILERYGMTETGMIASNPYDGARVAGSVGFALPGETVRICGEGTELKPIGEIGVVQVSGPNVFKGYLNAAEKTAASFTKDGFFITGDLGWMDAGGRLFLAGRQSDMIISGGYNVYPSEVENVLSLADGVLEAAVFGVKHPDWGEAVLAVVALRPRAAIGAGELIEHCRASLAAYKTPKQVFIVDGVPRNAMGKTDRKALAAQYAQAKIGPAKRRRR